LQNVDISIYERMANAVDLPGGVFHA
jgi:hypothetical protein